MAKNREDDEGKYYKFLSQTVSTSICFLDGVIQDGDINEEEHQQSRKDSLYIKVWNIITPMNGTYGGFTSKVEGCIHF